MRTRALLLGAVFILLSVVAFTQSMTLTRAQPTIILSDGFESDAASSFPNDGSHVGQCLMTPPNYEGGGNSTSTAVKNFCTPPPLTGKSGVTTYAWGAESNHICTTRGGCVKTNNNAKMGPNSIFAVVTEQAHTGNKSLKLGASDWKLDEVQAFMRLPMSSYPANNTVGQSITFTFSILMSTGVENLKANRFNFGLSSGNGETFLYTGHGGGCLGNNYCWLYWPTPQTKKAVPMCGSGASNFRLIPQTWHTIVVTVNLGTQVVYGNFTIDGVTPPSLICILGQPAFIEPQPNRNFYINNFYVQYLSDNQSEYYLGATNGWYVYLDDVSVTIGSTSSVGSSISASAVIPSFLAVAVSMSLGRKGYVKSLLDECFHLRANLRRIHNELDPV